MSETDTELSDYEAAWWANRLWDDAPEDAKEAMLDE